MSFTYDDGADIEKVSHTAKNFYGVGRKVCAGFSLPVSENIFSDSGDVQ